MLCGVLLIGACSEGDDDTKPTDTTPAAVTTEPSTSDTDATDTTLGVPEGSTEGISDTEINIAYVFSDTKVLQEAGLVPNTGDPYLQFSTFADKVNSAGGASGLQLNVTSHSFGAGAPATDQMPACISATEDENAAILVYLGGYSPELVLCGADDHERIILAISGLASRDVYDAVAGRYFNKAMSSERLAAGWVKLADQQGLLEGHTLGIIRGDFADHEVYANAIKAELEAAGYEITEDIALPCEGRSCEQNDVGAQRLQSSGVDTVFSLLSALAYPTFVGAAQALEYDPQWLSSDFENQVFNSSAKFMESVGDSYDGAIGFSYQIDDKVADDFGQACNDTFSEITGTTYTFGTESDAWLNTRSQCQAVNLIVAALDKAMEQYGVINQATIILAMETLDPTLGSIPGTWGPGKHDGANSGVLKTWSKDCLCWSMIEESITPDLGV